jgi:hypothetical protein
MRIQSTTRYAALAAIVGALACAGNKPKTEETPQPDERAAARDTTGGQVARDTTGGRDTLNGQVQNPPGYRGMERDTTMVPPTQPTPSDTFLQKQGEGTPQDTSGYSGIERDTTGQRAQPSQTDTTGFRRDTSGAAGAGDTTGMNGRTDTTQSWKNQSGLDSTGAPRTGDTTGYSPSQQARDSTAR